MTENAKKVYNLISQIPVGKISTYKIVADKLGIKSYRAVGQILKRNPDAPIVPCHRVIKTNGELGGYAGTNTPQKIKILQKEGLQVEGNKVVNYSNYIYKF
jgi:methylated-DNA-[protein]-cysteine S-methyltransferase